MPSEHRRSDRVAEGIREVVATFLTEEAKDPRLVGLVTITGVDVTRDLGHARIFVSVMGDDEARAATFSGLQSMASHLRSRVGRALRLRHAPQLTFVPDESVAHAARIESLLAQVRAADPESAAPDSAPDADGADGADRTPSPDGDGAA